MVFLGRKVVAGRTFYYLEQSFRLGGSICKRERFLGGSVPANIEELKRQFARANRAELLYPSLDAIQRGFAEERRTLQSLVRERNDRAFTVRFTYDSNRIEGSTLSLRETADLLDRQVTPQERPLPDVLEAEAHRTVFREMLSTRKDLSFQLILGWHHALFSRTKPDVAGKLRRSQVYISGARYTPPSPVEVHPLLLDLLRWYDRSKKGLHPVETAAVLHLRFESIHPFVDGNGRIGRLILNFVLHRSGWPMLNIPHEKRKGYYNALERSQTRQEEDIFIQWFIRRYLKENGRYRARDPHAPRVPEKSPGAGPR